MGQHSNGQPPKLGVIGIGLLIGLGLFLGAVLGTWK